MASRTTIILDDDEPLVSFCKGTVVRLANLSKCAQLNGKLCTVVKYDPHKQRYQVRLQDAASGENHKAVQASNMLSLPTSEEIVILRDGLLHVKTPPSIVKSALARLAALPINRSLIGETKVPKAVKEIEKRFSHTSHTDIVDKSKELVRQWREIFRAGEVGGVGNVAGPSVTSGPPATKMGQQGQVSPEDKASLSSKEEARSFVDVMQKAPINQMRMAALSALDGTDPASLSFFVRASGLAVLDSWMRARQELRSLCLKVVDQILAATSSLDDDQSNALMNRTLIFHSVSSIGDSDQDPESKRLAKAIISKWFPSGTQAGMTRKTKREASDPQSRTFTSSSVDVPEQKRQRLAEPSGQSRGSAAGHNGHESELRPAASAAKEPTAACRVDGTAALRTERIDASTAESLQPSLASCTAPSGATARMPDPGSTKPPQTAQPQPASSLQEPAPAKSASTATAPPMSSAAYRAHAAAVGKDQAVGPAPTHSSQPRDARTPLQIDAKVVHPSAPQVTAAACSQSLPPRKPASFATSATLSSSADCRLSLGIEKVDPRVAHKLQTSPKIMEFLSLHPNVWKNFNPTNVAFLVRRLEKSKETSEGVEANVIEADTSDEDHRSVVFSNLHNRMDDMQVENLLKDAGCRPRRVSMPRESRRNRSCGIAYSVLDSREGAERAVQKLDGKVVLGQPISVTHLVRSKTANASAPGEHRRKLTWKEEETLWDVGVYDPNVKITEMGHNLHKPDKKPEAVMFGSAGHDFKAAARKELEAEAKLVHRALNHEDL